MKTRDIAEIGFKLLGIYSAFQFLALLPTAFSVAQTRSFVQADSLEFVDQAMFGLFSRMLLSTNVTCFFYLIMAVVFLYAAPGLAVWLVKEEDSGSLNFSSADASKFLLQLAGIYALITWMPEFFQMLIRTLIYGSWQNPQVPALQRFYENGSLLVAPACGTLLGLFLLFRVNGMIRLIRLARPMAEKSGA